MVGLAAALTLGQTASAQDRQFEMLAQNNGPNSGAQNRNNQDRNAPQGKRRAGDWLRKYQNLPPQDQEKLLSNDPNFQKLPPERQSHLRNNLRNFNLLPPEKKQQVLDRMSKFESLPPAERE